jgi:hypothetical protein
MKLNAYIAVLAAVLFTNTSAAPANLPIDTLWMLWGARKCNIAVEPSPYKRKAQPPSSDHLPPVTTLLNPWINSMARLWAYSNL